MECIFCKIVSKELPAKIIFENDHVLAFYDINPHAPVHALLIPKKHVRDLSDLSDPQISGAILDAIKEVAKITGIHDSGYRVISNVGEDGGQIVNHLHFHILGGKKLGPKLVSDSA